MPRRFFDLFSTLNPEIRHTLHDGSCRGNSQKAFKHGATNLEFVLPGGSPSYTFAQNSSDQPHTTNPAGAAEGI